MSPATAAVSAAWIVVYAALEQAAGSALGSVELELLTISAPAGGTASTAYAALGSATNPALDRFRHPGADRAEVEKE